jgi:hypothetical protein
MSDINDRLAALDPAATQPYRPPALEDMVSRIVASSPSGAARSTWWQRVQLRMAGTLILGTVLSAGTLAVLSNGPSLPVLAIANAHAPTAFASRGDTMQLYEEIDFSPSPSLAASPASSPSYQLQIPSDSAAEAARVASLFGVTGSVLHSGSDWTVSDPSGAALDYQVSGIPQWYYSSTTPAIAPATASSSATGPLPSHAALAADVQGYLDKLGYGYRLSSPSFSTSTTSTTNANGTQSSRSQEEVSYVVSVDGLSTDQNVSFSVDANNDLVYAQGPAFRVDPSTGYPLQSPLQGVSTLNETEHSKFSAASGSASASAAPIVQATLNSASLSLASYQLSDGTTWLLPLYTYAGTVVRANGASATGTWSEIAIDPSYVHISATDARGIVNY